MDFKERFEAKYEKHESGCWLWKFALCDGGYGLFGIGKKSKKAHRVSYELYKKPIESECLDHLCRVRNCVNPDHLEEVTIAENNARSARAVKKTCLRGHDLSGDNLYHSKIGKRVCGKCRTISRQKHRKKL